MSTEKKGYAKYFVLAALSFLCGALMMLLPELLPDVFTEEIISQIMFWMGVVLLVVGVLCLLAAIAVATAKPKQKANLADAETVTPDAVGSVSSTVGTVQPTVETDSDKVRYVPSENVYNFINMGDRQSTEEKFSEIAKMDRTQFVIYIARLFSRKGYQVKFTPVIDNFDIDLLVEKMGVIIAVGCILTTKVLCEKDIHCVVEGSKHYQASNVMALTNMYFDRTAVDYAKKERMSLVDRNILAEDFMK